MPRIAISYRRADSAAISGRLFDRLTQHYGSGSVFMDIDEIPFGIDFREHIAEVLSTCDAVVVVIGPHWFGGEDPRRIDQPNDPVRIEVQTALERRVPVIPVLVGDAVMPTAEELPGPLQNLAYRNACEVATGRDFHVHVDRLIRSMDRHLLPPGSATEPRGAAAPAPARPASARPASGQAAAPPRGWLTWLLLAAVVALPQLMQFSGRKELFVVALCLSTIGTVHILDPSDRSLSHRLVFGTVLTCVVVVLQAGIGILRASFEAL